MQCNVLFCLDISLRKLTQMYVNLMGEQFLKFSGCPLGVSVITASNLEKVTSERKGGRMGCCAHQLALHKYCRKRLVSAHFDH